MRSVETARFISKCMAAQSCQFRAFSFEGRDSGTDAQSMNDVRDLTGPQYHLDLSTTFTKGLLSKNRLALSMSTWKRRSGILPASRTAT